MADNKKSILTESIQALVMSIGRERNAIEFYKYLSETIHVPKAREFFKDMVKRETDDMEEIERFLLRLKSEAQGDEKR